MKDQEEISTGVELLAINETFIDVPITQGFLYHAFVRSCIDVSCSMYINTTSASFSSLNGKNCVNLYFLHRT